MCSVCGTNRNYTEKILKELQVCIEASNREQARKDEYNTNCGPMDYDFDCCDCSYAELEKTVWGALKWLKIVPQDMYYD